MEEAVLGVQPREEEEQRFWNDNNNNNNVRDCVLFVWLLFISQRRALPLHGNLKKTSLLWFLFPFLPKMPSFISLICHSLINHKLLVFNFIMIMIIICEIINLLDHFHFISYYFGLHFLLRPSHIRCYI